jgi:hypothetical protein
MEPKSYPANNTEELQAIRVLSRLLDLERVKPSISSLDKVPNHDGTVELVDTEQRPIGELKIQVKKLPDGETRFDCPIELVAYSTRVSAPFVLICADVSTGKAYWRHLSPVMSEVVALKREQQTFTVRFEPFVDEVGAGCPYVDRWRELCADYQRRVSEHPSLKHTLETEIGLRGLSYRDRCNFQQFIDQVNTLLDVDFPLVKHECFAGTWKLGVSVHQVDSNSFGYSVYAVRNGENAPLLTHEPGSPGGGVPTSRSGMASDRRVLRRSATGTAFSEPVADATGFVFGYLKKVIQQKRLRVHGRNQSVELLMWFTRSFAHTLGLSVADTYQTSELSYGVNVFLPVWYSLAFDRMRADMVKNFGDAAFGHHLPSFESIARLPVQRSHPAEHEVRNAIAAGRKLVPCPIREGDFTVDGLSQAVDFLKAKGIENIQRMDRPATGAGALLWERYSRVDFTHNVRLMLQGAAEDYPDFIRGNRFDRLESRLASRDLAMVFAADTSKWQVGNPVPSMQGAWVHNPDRSLPPATFIDLAEEPLGFREDGDSVIVRGTRRKWARIWCPLDRAFLDLRPDAIVCRVRPIQSMLYELLAEELAWRYEGDGKL